MAEVGKLKQVKNGHRTTAKKKVNTARELMQNYDPANLELHGKLKAICITLKEVIEIVKEIDGQILDKTEEDSAINKEIEETTDFKEYIQECIVMIDLTTKKGEVEKPGAATGNQNTSPPVQNNQSESQVSKEVSIKLPKIQLQDFYGNPLDYPAFWDAFESTIDANPQLSPVNKFNYLKGMLKGQAEAAISGLKKQPIITRLDWTFFSQGLVIQTSLYRPIWNNSLECQVLHQVQILEKLDKCLTSLREQSGNCRI